MDRPRIVRLASLPLLLAIAPLQSQAVRAGCYAFSAPNRERVFVEALGFASDTVRLVATVDPVLVRRWRKADLHPVRPLTTIPDSIKPFFEALSIYWYRMRDSLHIVSTDVLSGWEIVATPDGDAWSGRLQPFADVGGRRPQDSRTVRIRAVPCPTHR